MEGHVWRSETLRPLLATMMPLIRIHLWHRATFGYFAFIHLRSEQIRYMPVWSINPYFLRKANNTWLCPIRGVP
jgi:hypothetical protein